jgi:hypothetical protein
LAFLGYNFAALSGMLAYGYSFKFKILKPGDKRKMNPKDLTLFNIVKKGSIHGVKFKLFRFLFQLYILVGCV